MKFTFTTFEELLGQSPVEVQALIDDLKKIRERPDFHPEESAWEHVKIVTERLIQTGDIDLVMAGIFHDIGKFVMNKTSEKTGFPSAPGHDKFGAEKALQHREWIKTFGADPVIVSEICENHMRMKQMDKMRSSKQQKMLELKSWDKLQIFTRADNMIDNFEWKNK